MLKLVLVLAALKLAPVQAPQRVLEAASDFLEEQALRIVARTLRIEGDDQVAVRAQVATMAERLERQAHGLHRRRVALEQSGARFELDRQGRVKLHLASIYRGAGRIEEFRTER